MSHSYWNQQDHNDLSPNSPHESRCPSRIPAQGRLQPYPGQGPPQTPPQHRLRPTVNGNAGQALSNPYVSPRHGRIPSQSGVQPFLRQDAQSSLPPHHRPTPTVHCINGQPPNDLQRWNGESVNPFMRWAYVVHDARGNVHPNYNYDPDMNAAISVCEIIDQFDREPRLMQELILRISNRDLGHESMDRIRENRSLVQILLYRHYQRHGGLILPPMAPAVHAMRTHEDNVNAARSAGVGPEQCPRMTFPPWPPLR